MKLLILTQRVHKNDTTLAFVHDWLREFASRVETLTVIALEVGPYDLPSNVRVFSLGKEKGVSRSRYIWNFFKYIISERKTYTHVFVHMNQVYVLLGGMLWKLWGKKISLWYVHRQVSLSLWLAEKMVEIVFTASKESFGLPSKKVHIVGHGIVIAQYLPPAAGRRSLSHRVVTLGRITRIKNIDILIQAAALLRDRGIILAYDIVGPTVTPEDEKYLAELKSLIRDKKLEGHVFFHGAVQGSKTAEYYWNSDINVNLAPPGGIDKVVLEGILGGALPLVSNTGFSSLFEKYNNELIFECRNVLDLANKIQALYTNPRREQLQKELSERVQKSYGLSGLIGRIINILQ